MMSDLFRLAEAWLALDRDEKTRREIAGLVERKDEQGLQDRLAKRLAFGTAGLRGTMGAGYARLNALTIIQTSQGLAAWTLAKYPAAAHRGVVIGYDARHNSLRFAQLAAAAFIAKGFEKIWWYEDLVHTPMVPFGVKHLQAAVGVMVTASHNPANDNGYKVYESTGCQINSPSDTEIAECILKNLEPLSWDVDSAMQHSSINHVWHKMTVLYIATLHEFIAQSTETHFHSVPALVYTPMHGVGLPIFDRALALIVTTHSTDALQPHPSRVVEEQARPDPDFPTVKYPNPEEHGALDLAKKLGDQIGHNIIIANDPDADRLAVAERMSDGKWIQFTGDQIGGLLAHYLIDKAKDGGRAGRQYVLTSAVSSNLLAKIAADAGIGSEQTLTGFKWLGGRAHEMLSQGSACIFAYEEALGYMIPDLIFDKDGISAAIIFLKACAGWGSPWQRLQYLYRKYGYHITYNTYWRSPSQDLTLSIFEAIRQLGRPYPQIVAHRNVQRWRDLTIGFDSATSDHKPDLPCSSSSQMITCWLEGIKDQGVRFTVRASGTESKIKIYLECCSDDEKLARESAEEALEDIAHEWFNHPGLTRAANS